MDRFQPLFAPLLVLTCSLSLLNGCATHQGYQGAGMGALTGTTAGILLDPDNRWRGAVIGGSLGALLGGSLTESPRYYTSPYRDPYRNPSYYGQATPYSYSRQQASRGALIGGVTGATAGALLDNSNSWRGGIIGGILGSLFGGSIGSINTQPGIPILHP
ncbi:YMGG-like glycine zipper-containing protein [Desulfogranum mediterraneum]|uniref:YMGG-like glycine zipper-containing protein n=1 Tax=Desulfogranum mediterraneum TaxID=160661 RepID=UPI00048D3B20|nr:YMGG-like glycine zipper-containing protein [Desulfogranum mediterraneum]